jgi:hypothetical protein
LSLQPITAYRNSPPVSGVGDKQLERTRREFLDLIKTDERRHDGGGGRENRDQKSGDQQQNAQETARQVRLAADRRAQEPSFLPASAGQTARPAPARPMREGVVAPARQTQQTPLPAASDRPAQLPTHSPALAIPPVSPRQPGPIAAPADARPQNPLPLAGSPLVAPASTPVAQDPGQPLQGFRLSSQVPREVAERIAQFMRTGALDREPFSFAPLNHVFEAEPALTPEQEADLAVASLLAEAAPHMRLPESLGLEGETGEGGYFTVPRMPGGYDGAATQAAIRAQALLQPPTLVPTGPGMQPAPSSASRGAANPLFAPAGSELGAIFGEGDDPLAAPREIWPLSRIA